MKTIFCPTDFSENAFTALEYAVQIARKSKPRIVIFNSFESPERTSGVIKVAQPGFGADNLSKLEALKSELVAKYPRPKLTIDIHVEEGNPKEVIVKVARVCKADLIIMGTKGAANLSELILGSVTATVINRSEIPVLAVPDTCKFTPIKKILFASDLEDSDQAALKRLGKFAAEFGASVDMLHVRKVDEQFPPAEMKKLEARYIVMLGVDSLKLAVRFHADIISGVSDFLKAGGFQVLAMVTRKRTIITQILSPSMTRKMAHYANLPLLVVKEAV